MLQTAGDGEGGFEEVADAEHAFVLFSVGAAVAYRSVPAAIGVEGGRVCTAGAVGGRPGFDVETFVGNRVVRGQRHGFPAGYGTSKPVSQCPRELGVFVRDAYAVVVAGAAGVAVHNKGITVIVNRNVRPCAAGYYIVNDHGLKSAGSGTLCIHHGIVHIVIKGQVDSVAFIYLHADILAGTPEQGIGTG